MFMLLLLLFDCSDCCSCTLICEFARHSFFFHEIAQKKKSKMRG
jgi:hypothetical protein